MRFMQKKLRGKLAVHMMANLPPIRCEDSLPFTHVGYDCFGSFKDKHGRKKREDGETLKASTR
jgi:hypothetical protein